MRQCLRFAHVARVATCCTGGSGRSPRTASRPPPTQAARAKQLETPLSDHIVTDPGYDGPPDFFAATSRVVIGPLAESGVMTVNGVAALLAATACIPRAPINPPPRRPPRRRR
ncbi:MAG: hypothetical protein HOV96_20500 [Nonomuraea sp.]|nr:hypothetical protein [Nonomuraea sp.]